ncbi:MAG: hypothetical protein H7330_05280 [Hymenobacteraceae bacterium]|nr:hypothetical protein [Hymenobacteraceae bacterium]
MKTLLLPLALGATTFLLTAQQCGSGPKASAVPGAGTVDVATMQRTWLHAHEEDHGDTLVFRPNTYAFPPSRGRTGFEISANGELTQYDIAPTDGLEKRLGRWRVEGPMFYATFPEKNSTDYSLRVLSLTPERLEAIRKYVDQ